MSEQTVTLRIVGENGQLVAAVRTSNAELGKLGAQARDTGNQAAAGARQVRGIGDAAQRSDRQVESLRGRLGGLKSMLAGVVGVQTLRQLASMGDSYSDILGKLRQVSGGERELAQAKADTFRIAQQTYQQLDATVTLYQRSYDALKQYNVGQQQVAALTETVNRGLLVSRATAAESASAILQLSQAMGAGALRGEEFNAVNEAAPRLMKLLAESIGRPRGELKKLAEDGKLTIDVLLKAFTGPQAAKLAEEAAAVPLTIGRAWVQFKNEALRAIGEVDQAQGASAQVAAVIGGLAKNMDLLIQIGATLAVVYGGKVLGSLVAVTVATVRKNVAKVTEAVMERRAAAAAVVAAQAQLRLAQVTTGAAAASTALTMAQGRLAAATAASRAAVAGLGAGMLAFVGGPVGAILIALGLIVSKMMSVKAAADAARGSMADMADSAQYARDSGDKRAWGRSTAELEARKKQLLSDRESIKAGGRDLIGTYSSQLGRVVMRGDVPALLKQNQAEIDRTQREIDRNWEAIWDRKEPNTGPQLNIPATDTKTPKPKKGSDDAKQRLEDMKNWREEAARAAATMEGPLKEAEVKRDQRLAELSDALGKGRIEQAAYNTLVKDAKRVYEEETEAARKATEEIKRRQGAPEKMLADMERERQLIGLTGREREIANEELRAEEELRRAIDDARDAGRKFSEQEVQDLENEARSRGRALVVMREQTDLAERYREQWRGAITSVADAWGQWFANGFRNTKDFLSQTRDAFKRWIADMGAMFAKAQLGKWLQVDLGAGTGGWGSLVGGQGGGSGGWMEGLQRMFGAYQQARGNGGGFWQSVLGAITGRGGGSGFGGSAGTDNWGSMASMARQMTGLVGAVGGASRGSFGTLGAIGGADTFGTGNGAGGGGALGSLGQIGGVVLNKGTMSKFLTSSAAPWLGAAAGAYYGWQKGGDTAGKALGAAAYGAVGYSAMFAGGAAVTAAAGGAAISGAAAVGLAAIPVVGWIALAAIAVDALSGGKLFGTKFKTQSAAQQFDFNSDGASGYNTRTDVRNQSLFRGRKWRTVTSGLDEETQKGLNEYFDGLQSAVSKAAAGLSVEMPDLISASFRREFDAKGNLQREFGTIAGRVYNEAQEAFSKRLVAENLLNVAKQAGAASEIETLADRYRGTPEAITEYATLMLAVQSDVKNATQLWTNTGPGSITAVTEALERMSRGAETLAETYQRVTDAARQYGEFMGGIDAELRTTGLNEWQRAALNIETQYRNQVKQANDLAKALGLSGARSEDLAKIELLRAKGMADLQKQMEAQRDALLRDFSLSDLSPLTDSQKLQESLSQLRKAVSEGDINTANSMAQSALGFGRNLYASGADYNALYGQVTGLLKSIATPGLALEDGTTMGELAQILMDLPHRIAQEMFELAAGWRQDTAPVVVPPAPPIAAPLPAPPPVSGGPIGGDGGGGLYMPGDPDRGGRVERLLERLVELATDEATGTIRESVSAGVFVR